MHGINKVKVMLNKQELPIITKTPWRHYLKLTQQYDAIKRTN